METQNSPQFDSSFRGQDNSVPPSGIAFSSDGKIIVSDDFNHRIQIYNRDGALLHSFGAKGSADGELCYPKGIAVDNDDLIYVADCWNHRIQVFDMEGKSIRAFGNCGEGQGELNEPFHLLIDNNEQLIVVERCNHRLQFFSKEGKSLGYLGSRGTVLEEKLGKLFQTPSSLLPPPLFEFPTSIAVDNIGNFYITDSGNHRIVKFDRLWNRISSFGEYGSEPGQFEYPMWLAMGPNDLLYVADLNNNQVKVLSANGAYIESLNSAGKSTPLCAPCLTAVDGEGYLYVGLSLEVPVHKYKLDDLTEIQKADNALQADPENLEILDWKAQIYEKENKRTKALEYYLKIVQLLWLQDAKQEIKPSSLESLMRMLRLIHKDKPDASSRPALIKGFEVVSRVLEKSRNDLMENFEAWDEVFPKFILEQVKEQNLILQERENEQIFNQKLYDLESEERKIFRKSRLQAHSHLLCSEKHSTFIYELLSFPCFEDSERETCFQSIKDHFTQACRQVGALLDVKEKNEQSLLQDFNEAAESQEKWASFLAKLNFSRRKLNLAIYFAKDIQLQLKNFKGALSQKPNDDALAKLIDELFIQSPGSHLLPKVLLGLQEDWSIETALNICLNDLIDNRTSYKYSAQEPVPATVDESYFSPVPYDTENLEIEDIAKFQITESLPFIVHQNGIALGGELYPFSIIGDPASFAKRIQEMADLFPVYKEKERELELQLAELIRQEIDLNDQLAQVNALDKKTPINLNNNIEIVVFQASLLRRMILTLEINQLDNLHRFALGTALLSNSPYSEHAEPIKKSLKAFIKSSEEEKCKHFSHRKAFAIQESQTNLRLEEHNSVAEDGQAQQILSNQKQRAEFTANKPFVELRLFQECRKSNVYRKIIAAESAPNHQLQINWMRSVNLNGEFIDTLFTPFSPALSLDGSLWVPSQENHSVIQFSKTGKYLSHFGIWGEKKGCLNKPTDLQIDADGNLIVADPKLRRITKFAPDGACLKIFGEDEPPENQPGRVNSISLDAQGKLWAADSSNNRLLIFNSDGDLDRIALNEGQLNIPTAIQCLEDEDILVGDKSDFILKRFNSKGEMTHSFSSSEFPCQEVYVIAYSSKYGIFISDVWRHEIMHLNEELELQSRFNTAGRRAGNLGRISGMIINGGELFVSDIDNQSVQVFELTTN